MKGLRARALSLWRARRGDFRHAIRVSGGCGATFALISLFNIPGGQWAVFTTIIVMQTSIGGTIGEAVERLIGTMVGAAAGAAAVYAQETTGADVVLILVMLVAAVAFVAASRPTLRAAPLTAVIMLVAHPVGLDPVTAALYRIGEIFVGGLVGVAATLLIFPAHAHAAVVARLTAVLGRLEALLTVHLACLTTGGADSAATEIHLSAREDLSILQTEMAEADRESASHVGASRHTEATARTAWRVRNDLVSLGRTLNEPLPVPAMIAPATGVLTGYRCYIEQCRLALTSGSRPDRIAFAKVHNDFQAQIQALREEGRMKGLPYEDLSQAFGFVFVIDALYANLGDLSDRLEDAREA